MPDIYEQLELHEGFESKVYPDSKGILTIGIGRNLQDKGITKAEAKMMLVNDVNEVVGQLSQYAWYVSLDPIRQKVLIDMAFNLGIKGLLKFRKMIKAIEERDYVRAAAEMKDSRWCAEVKTRADRLIKMMLTGEDYQN